MQRRFRWSDSVWETIDHHTFSQHFSSLTPARQQIPRMKFIHDQQPLGVRLARQSHSELPESNIEKCPCCLLGAEDQTHFLRCASNPVTAQALRDFQKTLHKKDLHAVYYLFSFGLLQWFASGAVPSPLDWDLRGYPVHMHATILDILRDQDKIGWLSGIKGFLSRHWLTLARCSMDKAGKGSLEVGRGRLRYLLKSLFTLTTAIWKGRNESLHGKSISTTTRVLCLEENEIRHYHTQPELLSHSDRHYCERPLSTILKSQPSNRRRWLRQVKLARHRRLTNQRSQSQLPQFYDRLSVTTPTSSVSLHLPSSRRSANPQQQMSLMSFLRPPHTVRFRRPPGDSANTPASLVFPTISSPPTTSTPDTLPSVSRFEPTRISDHSPNPLPAPPPRRQSSILSFFRPRPP